MGKLINRISLKVFRIILGCLCFLFCQETVAQRNYDDYDIPQDKWEMFNSDITQGFYVFLSDKGTRKLFNVVTDSRNPYYKMTFDGKDYTSVQVYDYDYIEVFWFYYRTEDKKLYRYNEKKQQEELLMDFGLAVGDVFERPDGVKLQVVEVSDTLIRDEKARRVLSLKGVNDESVWDKWIESYGSVRTGLHLVDDFPGYQLTDLLYMEKVNTSGIRSYDYSNGIYNDINKDYLRSVCIDIKQLSNKEVVFMDNQDYYLDGDILYYLWKYRNEKSYSFLLKETESILRLRIFGAGDSKFSYSDSGGKEYQMSMDLNLSPGTYTLYDADGVEQNITIGGDANAIGAIENDASTSKQGSGLFFDLTGRQHSTAPQHGIYIQDGRKVLK